jgi:hypothetical protein
MRNGAIFENSPSAAWLINSEYLGASIKERVFHLEEHNTEKKYSKLEYSAIKDTSNQTPIDNLISSLKSFCIFQQVLQSNFHQQHCSQS